MKNKINSNIEIIHGDAYKEVKKIADKSIDLIIIDPPYDIPKVVSETEKKYLKDGKRKNNKKISRIDKSRIVRNQSIENFCNGINFEILKDFERLQKKLNLFIFCNKTLLFKLINYYIDDKYKKEILVWCKTNPSPLINGTFLPDIEYIFYVRDAGVKLQGTIENRHKYFIQQANIEDKKLYLHPTIKPQNILNNLIKVASKEKDTILDCFMGSGSTGVACIRSGRKFIGIELDNNFYEISKNRLEDENCKISIFNYL